MTREPDAPTRSRRARLFRLLDRLFVVLVVVSLLAWAWIGTVWLAEGLLTDTYGAETGETGRWFCSPSLRCTQWEPVQSLAVPR